MRRQRRKQNKVVDSMFDSKNVFLGPILYFKTKSYTKGVLWLLLITTMLFANFLPH